MTSDADFVLRYRDTAVVLNASAHRAVATPMRLRVVNELSRRLFLRNWSDSDLAIRTGLSRLRVNRIKNRRVRPTVRDALMISRALGEPVRAVFRLVDEAGV